MTKDERQAAIDALNKIIQARQTSNEGPMPGLPPIPPGKQKIDIDIDPELTEIAPNNQSDSGDMPNIKINDPDNVLKNQKQQSVKTDNKNNQNQQQNPDNNEGAQGEQGDQQGSKNDSDNDKEENGAGSGSGSNKDDEDSKDSDGSGEDSDDEDKTSKGKDDDKKHTEDYRTAWNEIMDRFDKDEISEADLANLINQIKNGDISSL